MMKQNAKSYPYAEGTGYQALEMPYDGRQLSMDILLPAGGQFSQFETKPGLRQITIESWQPQEYIHQYNHAALQDRIRPDPQDYLNKMGIKDALNPSLADFFRNGRRQRPVYHGCGAKNLCLGR